MVDGSFEQTGLAFFSLSLSSTSIVIGFGVFYLVFVFSPFTSCVFASCLCLRGSLAKDQCRFLYPFFITDLVSNFWSFNWFLGCPSFALDLFQIYSKD